MIIAPKMVLTSFACAAMAVIVGTYAKLTPIMTGSPLPSLIFCAYNCNNVDSAANTRDTWIKSPMSTFPPALFAAFATRMAGVTHPTTAASTCCAARGSTCPNDGLPSHLNNSELSFFCFVSFIFIHPILPPADTLPDPSF